MPAAIPGKIWVLGWCLQDAPTPANRSFDELLLDKIKGPASGPKAKKRRKVHMKTKIITDEEVLEELREQERAEKEKAERKEQRKAEREAKKKAQEEAKQVKEAKQREAKAAKEAKQKGVEEAKETKQSVVTESKEAKAVTDEVKQRDGKQDTGAIKKNVAKKITYGGRKRKRKDDESESEESEEDEEEESEESDTESEESEEETSEEESDGEDQESTEEKLIDIWRSVSPPVTEEDVVNKWYGVIYTEKKRSYIYVGKVLKRFLDDVDGPATGFEIDCLKPHIGSGTVLESYDYTNYKDISVFPSYNLVFGPLKVEPLKGNKWSVPEYEELDKFFTKAQDLKRKELFNTVFKLNKQ